MQKIVIDKFQVIQHVYEALQQVCLTIKKQLLEQLSEKKKRTEKDQLIQTDLELLKCSRPALNKSEVHWTENQKQIMQALFKKYPPLKKAYELVQRFKGWYAATNIK